MTTYDTSIGYNEFLNQFTKVTLPNKHRWERAGQCLMNALKAVNKPLHTKILDVTDYAGNYTLSGYDCFFRDEIMPKTLKYIKENWTTFSD